MFYSNSLKCKLEVSVAIFLFANAVNHASSLPILKWFYLTMLFCNMLRLRPLEQYKLSVISWHLNLTLFLDNLTSTRPFLKQLTAFNQRLKEIIHSFQRLHVYQDLRNLYLLYYRPKLVFYKLYLYEHAVCIY